MDDTPSAPQNLTFVSEPLALDINSHNKTILEIGVPEEPVLRFYKPEIRHLQYHSHQYIPNDYEFSYHAFPRSNYITLQENSCHIGRDIGSVSKGSPKMSDQGNQMCIESENVTIPHFSFQSIAKVRVTVNEIECET